VQLSYAIDPRKNWALAEARLATESDPKRHRNFETLIAHSKSEAKPDFDGLMATVAPNASDTSYAAGSGGENSPTGIVGSGCNYIEPAAEGSSVSSRRLRGRRRRSRVRGRSQWCWDGWPHP
jgi:hypothetical protein